ncbi:MAG TPA: quinolinate synthase NadA, partial [Candidatus Methylacidiphilales bacterium]
YCRETPARSFIIATESGMLHRLRRELPEKEFIPGPTEHCACADCRYMKMNTLEKVYEALRDEKPELVMATDLREKALIPLQRMLDWSKN